MAKTADTIAIYSRKSRYTGKGESIGNQIDLCREYIRTHYGDAAAEHTVVFEDEGFSGGNLNRPVFLFSVFQHFSPFSVQDSGTVPILFAKIIAVRQPHPPPLLWFPPLPLDEPPKLRLNAIMSFRQLFFSGKHVFPVQIHLSTSYSSNKGVLL